MRSNAWAACLGFSLILLASLILPPPGADGRIAHLPDICPFYNLTGFPCPGCGLTRAFVSLGHGQLGQAFGWNPLGPLLYLVCVLLWLRAALTLVKKRPVLPLSPLAISRSSKVGLFVIVAFGVARIGYLMLTHHAWPLSLSR